jgi:uncharacterized protein
MSQLTQIFDLGGLRLHSGEGRQVELNVPIDGFSMGGQDYTVASGRVIVKLDVSHTTNGYALRLRYDTRVDGPCMRCLDNAGRRFDVDAYEIDQPGGGEDLTSPYLHGHATPSCWRCPPRFCAATIARASARSAARTSTPPGPSTCTRKR